MKSWPPELTKGSREEGCPGNGPAPPKTTMNNKNPKNWKRDPFEESARGKKNGKHHWEAPRGLPGEGNPNASSLLGKQAPPSKKNKLGGHASRNMNTQKLVGKSLSQPLLASLELGWGGMAPFPALKFPAAFLVFPVGLDGGGMVSLEMASQSNPWNQTGDLKLPGSPFFIGSRSLGLV
eukprot:UN3397